MGLTCWCGYFFAFTRIILVEQAQFIIASFGSPKKRPCWEGD
jgi:hypothetical protein